MDERNHCAGRKRREGMIREDRQVEQERGVKGECGKVDVGKVEVEKK